MECWLLSAAGVFEMPSSYLVAMLTVTAASCLNIRAAHADHPNIATIRERADSALAARQFASAYRLYRSILARDPRDTTALREAGRAAHAMRDFASAVALLQNAAAAISTPDPELHYLLAEALWVLGRKSEASAEYSVAKREIGASPTERLQRLWLARIDERFADRDAACAIYNSMAAAAPADEEVALAHAEMHAAAGEWSSAEASIRGLLAVQPGHKRALEMLAWITEAQGKLATELALREALARHSTTSEPVRDYGRALERSGDWAAALATYRRAENLPGGAQDQLLGRAILRLSQRMSIELAAGAIARTDSGVTALGGSTGIAVPFGSAHHVAVGAWRESISHEARDGSANELFGLVALNGVATSATAGFELSLSEVPRDDGTGTRRSTAPAASAGVRHAMFDGHLELGIEGELNALWRETPLVELEGGRVDSLTAHVWVNAFEHRLVVEGGAQARRLRFVPDDMDEPRAAQLLAWAGADWQLWGDASRQAAGEILDDDLRRPTFLASSVVASYRHYEALGTTNAAFMQRLALADHTSTDQLSLAIRMAVSDGRLAFDVHGGVAHDHARDVWIESGSFALWVATGASSRLALSFDIATEGDFAIGGQRISGGASYHVDL